MTNSEILPSSVPALRTSVSPADGPTGLGGIPLDAIERQAILETLRQTSGNQTRAAKVLGISDRTLREKVRRYRREECEESQEAVSHIRRPLLPVS
jgi:DNA-binding protein Fis